MSLAYYLDQDGIVAHWVAQMILYVRARGFGPCSAIGVVDADTELIAGVVYHHLSHEVGVMEMTIAAVPGKKWLTRKTLEVIYHYPFEQCGCQMLIAHAKASDMRVLRQLAAVGWKFEPFPRLYGRHEDGVTCRLTDDAWRESKFNKKGEAWRMVA
jgi:hypothetical protein